MGAAEIGASERSAPYGTRNLPGHEVLGRSERATDAAMHATFSPAGCTSCHGSESIGSTRADRATRTERGEQQRRLAIMGTSDGPAAVGGGRSRTTGRPIRVLELDKHRRATAIAAAPPHAAPASARKIAVLLVTGGQTRVSRTCNAPMERPPDHPHKLFRRGIGEARTVGRSVARGPKWTSGLVCVTRGWVNGAPRAISEWQGSQGQAPERVRHGQRTFARRSEGTCGSARSWSASWNRSAGARSG